MEILFGIILIEEIGTFVYLSVCIFIKNLIVGDEGEDSKEDVTF